MRFQKSAIFDHSRPVISGQVVLSFSDKKTAKKFPGSRRSRKKIQKNFFKKFFFNKLFYLRRRSWPELI